MQLLGSPSSSYTENENSEQKSKCLLCLLDEYEVLHNCCRYSDSLRAGRSGDRIPVGARISAPVQTGSGDHPALYKMDTRCFSGVKSGRGVTLTPQPLLVPWSRKSRATPPLPLWAVRPVQSLSACTRVTFTFTFVDVTTHTHTHTHTAF